MISFSKTCPRYASIFPKPAGAGVNLRAGFDKEVQKQYDTGIERLASVLEKGTREGVLRAHDPYHMAIALDGIINSFLFRMMEDPARFQGTEDLSVAADIFLEGVRQR